jgi:hypothetical protein
VRAAFQTLFSKLCKGVLPPQVVPVVRAAKLVRLVPTLVQPQLGLILEALRLALIRPEPQVSTLPCVVHRLKMHIQVSWVMPQAYQV